MEYAIIRADKIKSRNQLIKLHQHNSRSGCISNNIDQKNTQKNIYRKVNDLDEILEKNNIKPRKNAILAIEYVVAINDETAKRFGGDQSKVIDWFKDNLRFIIEKHGQENIIEYALHLDEKNPHAHITVAPVVEKTMKKAVKKRLDASYFIDGVRKLHKLQNDYAKAMSKHGLKRGSNRVMIDENNEIHRVKRPRLTLKQHDQVVRSYQLLRNKYKEIDLKISELEPELERLARDNHDLKQSNNDMRELRSRLKENLAISQAKVDRLNTELLKSLEDDLHQDDTSSALEEENEMLREHLKKANMLNELLSNKLDQHEYGHSYDR